MVVNYMYGCVRKYRVAIYWNTLLLLHNIAQMNWNPVNHVAAKIYK